ncbi:LytR/AlgR family response regulator transcription factor [Rubrivivax gelatinosus]|uniref:Two component transcriptional regulator, LytTR family n=1 Tax=Rubrivivax gelatinosus (strain NBRC 100245 / IL144) TaxID=983917 RepID=I0HUF5_RUBGI|nr:LytTR family DNA-binding domain-containing protein [Rubrivivax gelatinosus]MBG6078561.1 DNA-binding LytR/AlgR family response regulator [Rubrivivax gelatinosus]BAL96642.1 two component transcriptional regulator, LytTR family [Rubrivivax gelatinosus IL144]
MIRIAICDDQPDDLQRLVAQADRYFSHQGIDAEVTGFADAAPLLGAMATKNFHLYLLDIVMPMVSGLELGQEIRRLDREAQIVYTTTEPQFALRAYAVQPLAYLVKPVVETQLFDTLALAVAKADVDDERTFAVKTADGLRVIRLADIACCEYHKHAAVFDLRGGEKITSRSFRESFADYCAPALHEPRFVQCHAAFVVNMRHVERFGKDSFTLCSGKVVPIAEKRYAAVRDAYLDYLVARP